MVIQTEVGEIGKETDGIGNQRKNQDYTNHSIVSISWNTQKRPDNLTGQSAGAIDTPTATLQRGKTPTHPTSSWIWH